jgi:hypothetical protein
MYLFPQPTRLTDRGVQSKHIFGEAIDEFIDTLSEAMNHKSNRMFEDYVALTTFGSQIASHMVLAGYSNILVCTSFEHNTETILVDGDDRKNVSEVVGAHMFPLVWKRLNCEGTVSITRPRSAKASVFDKAYDALGVISVPCDEYYYLDNPAPMRLDRTETPKYDAVVIIEPRRINPSNRKFRIEEIKKDFASHCTSDFDIITLFAPGSGVQILGSKSRKTKEIINKAAAHVHPVKFEENLSKNLSKDVTGRTQITQPIGYFNLRRFYNKVVKQFRIL